MKNDFVVKKMRNFKKTLILLLFVVMIVNMTMASVSAEYPTKYKVKTTTATYNSYNAKYYEDFQAIVWGSGKNEPKFSNYAMREYKYSNKTKLEFSIYNNNGNRFHHTDCISSKVKIKYTVVKGSNKTVKTKTYTYKKIPKYGVAKTITLNYPKNSYIKINQIKWSRTVRNWY